MTLNVLRVFTYILKMPPFYYAVAKGRNPGIYNNWSECKSQVHQFSGPIFKKFSSKSDAEDFVKRYTSSSKKSSSISNGKKLSSFKAKRSASTWQERKALSKVLSSKLCNKVPEAKKIKLDSENKTESINSVKPNSSSTSSQQTNYIVDADGYVNVYTDGACSSNGRKNAKAGIGVWFGDNHSLNLSQPVIGRATNNMAEIQAVMKAAEQAKKAGIKKLKINTDSKFLISCITQWMPKWKKNGWQTASKQPVINKTELIEMEKALQSLDVAWNHVNGHVGIYGNEMADKLAREGCENYKK